MQMRNMNECIECVVVVLVLAIRRHGIHSPPHPLYYDIVIL